MPAHDAMEVDAAPARRRGRLVAVRGACAKGPGVGRRRGALAGVRYVHAREVGGGGRVPPVEVIRGAERVVLGELDGGRYLELDRPSDAVRSTISIAFSCDGGVFASTHGDHTVKVIEFPGGGVRATLEGHPRTPWTVRFHPSRREVLATGCLGKEVRVWDWVRGVCLCTHTFAASISCLAFSPGGDLLAVTSGNNLMVWAWTKGDGGGGEEAMSLEETRAHVAEMGGYAVDGVPRLLLRGGMPFYCCDFHPTGRLILIGEKNDDGSEVPDANTGGAARDDQFTLNVTVHRFNVRVGVDFDAPLLTVSRVVAYNDAGIHFSHCGSMLLACIPMPKPIADPDRLFRIAVLSLADRGPAAPVGTVLFQAPIDNGRTIALTNLKFSPSAGQILAGYSYRIRNPVLRARAEKYAATLEAAQRADALRRYRRCAHRYACPHRAETAAQRLNPEITPDTPPEAAAALLRFRPACCYDNPTDAAGDGDDDDDGAAQWPVRPPQVGVVDLYEPVAGSLRLRNSLTADVDVNVASRRCGTVLDEINIAMFARSPVGHSEGVVYGTQKGRVRLFKQLSDDGEPRPPSPPPPDVRMLTRANTTRPALPHPGHPLPDAARRDAAMHAAAAAAERQREAAAATAAALQQQQAQQAQVALEAAQAAQPAATRQARQADADETKRMFPVR